MVSSQPDPANPTSDSDRPEVDSPVTTEAEPAVTHAEPADAPGWVHRIRSAVVAGLPYDPTTPRGWLVTVCGLGGTLLIATSYLASWLTATLEHRDGVDSHAMALHELTTTPLTWMYRIATLAMVTCAVTLVYAPPAVVPPLRIVGFSGAALSLYSALVATFVITSLGGALSGAMSVRYGFGLYAGYLGVVAVACFIGMVGRRDVAGPAVTP